MPTVPKINKGPELLVKAKSLSHSSLVQVPSSLKRVTILAPIGYPLTIPIIKANAPSPGTLKNGRINLFNNFPRKVITFVYPKSSVAIKNGRRAGTTELAHKINPSFAADKLSLEKITKDIVNNTKRVGIKFFRMENIIKLCFLLLIDKCITPITGKAYKKI